MEKERGPIYRAAVPPKKYWNVKPEAARHFLEVSPSQVKRGQAGSDRWSSVLGEGKTARSSLYLTVINPHEYLNRTARGEDFRRQKEEQPESAWSDRYVAIKDRLMKAKPTDPIQWWIWNKNCEILGHEGRHRAAVAATLSRRYPKLKKVPILVACVSDYYSYPRHRYEYLPWQFCKHCLEDFPHKLIKQKDWYGRHPRSDDRFDSQGYRPSADAVKHCERCKTKLYPSESKLCRDCQTRCRECGRTIAKDSTFCSSCKRM